MFSPAYKRYAMVMLATLYGVNFLDGSLMALLLQPIKMDLQLTDTQLGLVTGIAFGLLYATLGVPIARWADSGVNRVTIAAWSMGLGGLAAMGLYWVASFVPLLLLRVAAGLSDAGCKPLTYSLLGDYFPRPADRTRAMYAWFLAGPLTGLIGKFSGGWLNEHYGWRVPFFLSGLLGVLLAVLAKFTLVEPRTRLAPVHAEALPLPPMTSVLSLLWNRPSCRQLTTGIILLFMVGQGALVWKAAFLMRSHGLRTTEVGLWLGISHGLGAMTGMLLGRSVVNRWFAENERAQMRLAAAALAVGAPILLTFLSVPNKEPALVAMVLMSLVLGAFTAPPYVMLQRLVPDQMRATVLMMVMLLANLIGYGAGPLIVGSVSDLLTPRLGTEALRYAMMLGAVGWVGASYCFLRVARTIDADLRKAAAYGTP